MKNSSPFPLPDMTEIPAIGSPEREGHEEAALARGRELLHQEEGRIREALWELEQEIRDLGGERTSHLAYDIARRYSRLLVDHVEQCWATAVLR